jgi:hypothetical protein
MYAERMVQHILMIAKERKEFGYEKRWQDFKDVVGEANGLMVEGIEDIPAESIGMTINYVDNTAKKELITQICIEKVKTGEIDESFLYLLMGVDNWKYMFVLLMIGIKKGKAERAEQAAREQQNIMQQKDMDLKIAQALNNSKTEGKNSNIMVQGKVDEMLLKLDSMLKHQSQMEIKDKIKDNKIEEENTIANIKDQAPVTA